MKKCSFVRGTFKPAPVILAVMIAGACLTELANGQITTTVLVPAGNVWTDTGVAVFAGQTVTVSASGTWCWPECNGPDGGTQLYFDEFAWVHFFDHGMLLGFVGPDPYQGHGADGSFFPQTSGYFSIGSGKTFLIPYSGELWLGLNDDAISGNTGDNIGQLTAAITVGSNDSTGPAIKISAPTTVYAQNQKVKASYSCTDPDDAVASCAGWEGGGPPSGTP